MILPIIVLLLIFYDNFGPSDQMSTYWTEKSNFPNIPSLRNHFVHTTNHVLFINYKDVYISCNHSKCHKLLLKGVNILAAPRIIWSHKIKKVMNSETDMTAFLFKYKKSNL